MNRRGAFRQPKAVAYTDKEGGNTAFISPSTKFNKLKKNIMNPENTERLLSCVKMSLRV
jgi:hypothetical protein